MALILLTAAELGTQSDWLINTDWIMFASKERIDEKKRELSLLITFAVTQEAPPIGSTAALDRPTQIAFEYSPDPDAVLLRISQAR